MKTKSILIVEDNLQTLELLRHTFDKADVRYQICSSSADAWNVVSTNPGITDVLLRMSAKDIQGCQLCERIREVKALHEMSVLMIVAEEQLEHAAAALDAGANDILIDPFEARELRMRMELHVPSHQRRVDAGHPVSGSDASAPALNSCPAPEPLKPAEPVRRSSQLLLPQFDPVSLRFRHDSGDHQIAAWHNDETVTKVALDQIMVCPCCESLPTFRLGCPDCGSASTKREPLVHHYACAHVGPESEFRQAGDLSCPKCLQKGLVAGADFETVAGCQVCADCGSRNSEPQLIGHCLSCQHRFPASDAKVRELTGFYVHRVHEVVCEESSDAKRSVSRRHLTDLTAAPQTAAL